MALFWVDVMVIVSFLFSCYLKIDPLLLSMKLCVYPKYVDFDGKYDAYDVDDGCWTIRNGDVCGAI